jgi:hypothetical protein
MLMMSMLTKGKLLRKLKTGVCALALAGVMLVPGGGSFAADRKVTESVQAEVRQDAQTQTAEKRQKITAEALAALQETTNALKALDEGKTEEALTFLEKATGKLEIVLAREPHLAFAPVAVTSSSLDIVTSVDMAKQMVGQAEDLLKDGKVQEARALLSTLASETAITVTSLPMASYPAALKKAVALLDSGKVEEAKIVLQVALNTLAVDVTIIPIPVANAEVLLAQAQVLAETKDRSAEQNRQLAQLLDAAESEIKFAQVLGYGEKKDFEGFYEEINAIRDKTFEGKSGTGFFKKITGYMNSMTENSQRGGSQ